MCVLENKELQRGVPPPYGEAFSRETLIRSASSKAFAATTEARIGEQSCHSLPSIISVAAATLHWLCVCAGPDSDPLRDGFQATSLDQDEVCLAPCCLAGCSDAASDTRSFAAEGRAHPRCLHQTQRSLEWLQSSGNGSLGYFYGLQRQVCIVASEASLHCFRDKFALLCHANLHQDTLLHATPEQCMEVTLGTKHLSNALIHRR